MLKEILMSAMVLFNSTISNSLVNANSNSFNNVSTIQNSDTNESNLSNDSVNAKVDTDINNGDNVSSYWGSLSSTFYDFENQKFYISYSCSVKHTLYRSLNYGNSYTALNTANSGFTYTNDSLNDFNLSYNSIIKYYDYSSSGYSASSGSSSVFDLVYISEPLTYYRYYTIDYDITNSKAVVKMYMYHNYLSFFYRYYLNNNLVSTSYSYKTSMALNTVDDIQYFYSTVFTFTFSNLVLGFNYSVNNNIYSVRLDNNNGYLNNEIFSFPTIEFTYGYKSYIEEFATFDTDLENKTCVLDSFLLYSNTDTLKIEYYLNDLLKATKELKGTSETTIVGYDTFTYTFNDTGCTFTDLDLYKTYDCYIKIYCGDTLIQTSDIETFEMGSVLYYEEFASFLTDLDTKSCQLESFLLYSNVQNLTLDYYLNGVKVGSKSLVGIEDLTEINNNGSYSYSFDNTSYTFNSLNLDSSYDCYIKFYNTDTNEYLKMTNIQSFVLTTNLDSMKIYDVYVSDIYSSSAKLNYSFYSAYTPIVIYTYLNDVLLGTETFQNVSNQKYNNYFGFKDLKATTKYNYKLVITSTLSSSNIVSRIFEGSFNTSSGSYYGDIVDLPSLMFNILAMPFAFYSQAFNLTLFAGTPYAINIGDVIMFIISLVILITIIKIIISMKG